ncbi:MAG: GNAT family N-acetyltransferase [Succinivibrionaceae bacterium]|nr:GNAT family N-acetyltransferase [Succinivibrionaceae bacterium]
MTEPSRPELAAVTPAMMMQIRRIERYCFAPYLYRTNRYFARRRIRGVFLAAFLDGRLAGYIACAFHPSYMSVSDLAVSVDFRRRGVASTLLGEVLKRKHLRGRRNIRLMVDPSHADAVALYEKFGFRAGKVRLAYYAFGDGMMMTKRIDEEGWSGANL